MPATTPAPGSQRRRSARPSVREIRLIGLCPPDPDARRAAVGARLKRSGRDYTVGSVQSRRGATEMDGGTYLHLNDPSATADRG